MLPMLKDYLARTGLTLRDFARRINYSTDHPAEFSQRQVPRRCRHAPPAVPRHRGVHPGQPIEPPQQVLGELYETENVRIIRRTIEKLLKYPLG